MKKSAKSWDKAIMIGTIPFFIALLIIPGLDAVRYQWSQVSFAQKRQDLTQRASRVQRICKKDEISSSTGSLVVDYNPISVSKTFASCNSIESFTTNYDNLSGRD